MCEEVTIQINENIEKIICENLREKSVDNIVKLESCEGCWYYEQPWVRGGRLHCCSQDYDNTRSSREIDDLYKECPINHELQTTKTYIKKYGIIHEKPRKGYYSRRGCISVVDFSKTTFEWDGHNPDVDWENVVVFYYKNQEEADIMMELALEYYHKFNLDAEYVKKHCYG